MIGGWIRKRLVHLNLLQTLSEVIEFRSFSNLWFWIALAVLWSNLSHRILGVPVDMVNRARKKGGQHAQDLHDLARIHVNRLVFVSQSAGVWILALGCFLLSTLATLGFFLKVEFAQAVFLLMLPFALVKLINLAAAYRVLNKVQEPEELYQLLLTTRGIIQFLGVIFIFLTATWGMYQNLQIGALG